MERKTGGIIEKDTRCKIQTRYNNQIQNFMKYDLEDRTTEFGKRVIRLCRAIPNNDINTRLIKQVVGSADSVGANYREANDALGKKDMIMRMKISRKEAKETKHHLELIAEANLLLKPRMKDLLQENQELINILSTIIKKLN